CSVAARRNRPYAWHQFQRRPCDGAAFWHNSGSSNQRRPPLASASSPRTPLSWLSDQPYLLLSLTSLFWAGNAIVGRNAAGHIPPVTLSFVRWGSAFLIVLPFAWPYVAKDWSAIRGRLGVMIVLSVCGIGGFNTLQY